MTENIRAIDLTSAALGRLVTVTENVRNEVVTGRLDRIELPADPRVRVVLRIATRKPINEADGGGYYWNEMFNETFVNHRTVVEVGDVAEGPDR